MQYSYTKSPVAVDRLTKEIRESAITIALDYINLLGSALDIFFKAALSLEEVAILDALVLAHTGTPLPDNTALPVDVRTKPSYGAKTLTLANGTVKRLFKRDTGQRYAVAAATTTEIIYTATYPWAKITGVECIGAELGDYVDFKVYDDNLGTYSGVPNQLLNQFSFTLNIPKDFYRRRSEFDADLYQNMVIKIIYYSVSAKTVGFNFLMDEVKT